ncbi:MAG TPA: histidinol-phosphate transaminase [Polyangiales bacterium]|nr:histidinol-phosphate transaminase [Polyangiales bacterium]
MKQLRPLVAPHVAAVQAYVPGKPPEELERELGIHNAVKLASNENPLGPSAAVVQAIRAAAETTHRYPDDRTYALRVALAARLSVEPDELAFGHGSNELIDLCVRAFATPAEHAVIGAPSFSCYGISLRAAGIPTTVVPLRDQLYWDMPALAAAVRPNTKLVFIDNPNNPTSTHVPRAELERFLSEIDPSVIVVIDEAYFDFADSADYISALELRRSRERLIVVRTFSKAYALASLRVGYAIGRPELVSNLDRIRVPFNANGLAQSAALAALSDRAHLERVVALNTSERARLGAALTRLGFAVAPSQTNFLCVDIGRPSAPVFDALLRKGVIVRAFGAPLDRHLRISVGLPDENDRLLEVLPEVLRG